MPALSPTPAVNAAVAAARSLPGLVANLQSIDPALAAQLESKPLLASRTPWGVAVASLIGMAAAHYGVGLDTDTTALLSGVLVLLCTVAGSYAMRLLTKQPIAGIASIPVSVIHNQGA